MGEKRIGAAVSDPGGLLAFPLAIIQRTDEGGAIEQVARLVAEQGAVEVVVGLPRSLSGATGPQEEKVQAFVDALKQKLSVPVNTYDERLTTVAAQRRLREGGGGGRKKGVKQHPDAVAAAIILQDYLDSRGQRSPQ